MEIASVSLKSVMGSALTATWTAAVCVAVIGIMAFKLRHRIEAIPVQLSARPAPSGPASPTRTSLMVPGAHGEEFTVEIWHSSGVTHSQPLEQGRIPVVLYVPGWGNGRDDNTLLCAELASHGFAVIALDDISKAPSTIREDRDRDTAPFDLSSDAALVRSLAAAEWRLNRMTARVSAIIRWLQVPESAKVPGLIKDSLDGTRVAVVGFSFGGSVAAEMTRRDARVAAAINMDGWLFGTSAKSGLEKPVLTFNSDYPALAADSTSETPARRLTAKLTIADRALQVRNATGPGTVALLFRATDHGDFSDELFAPPLGAYLERWRRTNSDRLRLRATMNQLILSFLESHLARARTVPRTNAPDLQHTGIEPLPPPMAAPPVAR